MAEVENLLGLITDEETRTKLLAQMEQMFDAAEDEDALIEQIGSPTKVAVALIRYAEKKRGEAASAPESAPAQTPEAPAVTEMLEEAEANAAAPEENVMPELAIEQAAEEPAVEPEEPAVEPEEPVVEPEEPVAEPEVSGFVEEVPEERTPVDEMAEAFLEASQELRGKGQAKAAAKVAEEAPAAPAVDEALIQAVTAEAAEAFGEVPAEEAAEAVEEALPEKELAEEIFGEAKAEEEPPVFLEEAGEPETKTVKVGWKAFLYFLIPGLVPGLPVFLVLFALSLVFLALGAAAIGCAVGVFMSAFIGYSVVADMLLLIGAGLSIFAVALVLMWFAIWFLTKVCFGWVRLIHRGGIRFSRKEVQVA